MITEDEVRKVPHPEIHERLGSTGFQITRKSLEHDPQRRVGPGELPLGCSNQGRQPWLDDIHIDHDICMSESQSDPEPWWPYILGGVCALLALVLIFAPVGVVK